MSNSLDWHKFWFRRWTGDEFVKTADLETLGAYIVLITAQMDDGSDLPDDLVSLAAIVGHFVTPERFAFLWNEKKISTKFKVAGETWIITGDKLDDGYWEPGEPRPGRIHNRFTTKVMTVDRKNRRVRQEAGSKGGLMRTKSLESYQTSRSEVDEILTFDFSELLKIMPKRKVKGKVEGWEQGKEMLKYIVTQDEFNNLLAATKEYNKRRGNDPAYFYSLVNWVTKEHYNYVPAVSSRAESNEMSKIDATIPHPAQVAQQKRFPPSWCVPENPTRPTDAKPPWVDIPFSDLPERQRCARLFPTDAEKRAWWMTTDNTEQHAGA